MNWILVLLLLTAWLGVMSGCALGYIAGRRDGRRKMESACQAVLLRQHEAHQRGGELEILVAPGEGKIWVNGEAGCLFRGYEITRARIMYGDVELHHWEWNYADRN